MDYYMRIKMIQPQNSKRKSRVLGQHAEVLTDTPGRTSLVEFDMKLMDSTPVGVKNYPLLYAKAESLNDKVQQMS